MNIIDILDSVPEELNAEIAERRISQSLTQEEAIDSIVNEVIETTKRQAEEGICHGEVHDMT